MDQRAARRSCPPGPTFQESAGHRPGLESARILMKIITRDVPPRAVWALEQGGVHPLLARLFAARGITSKDELDDALARLIPPTQMLGAQEAARAMADAMAARQRICIVADYDCDGATACAVAVRGLRLLGAPMGFDSVEYLVPDRVTDGYGLTPSI